jgi:hypothetical protein
MKARSVASAFLFSVALVSSSLISGTASAEPQSSRGQAILVSASGNTELTSVSALRTPYPWGYYSTKALCEAAGRRHMQQQPGSFYGFYCVKGTGAHRNDWQLYMDEIDCTDRVEGTLGIGAGTESAVASRA